MKPLKPANPSTTGRLNARPVRPTEISTCGLQALNFGNKRDGLIYVPQAYQSDRPAPLLLMLHGAGGDAEGSMRVVQRLADIFNLLVLAVDSREQTWDVILSRYGADIAFIDQALAYTFARYTINPQQFAIGGFSDGASYALSVGIMNGDLFSHVLAFSPGFIAPAAQIGKPQIFISHGKRDTVLPIERCSRQIVPRLQQAGYNVQYREFDGSHIVPEVIAREGLTWFTT